MKGTRPCKGKFLQNLNISYNEWTKDQQTIIPSPDTLSHTGPLLEVVKCRISPNKSALPDSSSPSLKTF